MTKINDNSYTWGSLAVSIVSHQHGSMVWSLVHSILESQYVTKLIITINVNEFVPKVRDSRIVLIINPEPNGFGKNHNNAFEMCGCDFFCVVNPDIIIQKDPFGELLKTIQNDQIGVVSPKIFNTNGLEDDNKREFITPLRILKRVLGISQGKNFQYNNEGFSYPDWIAGMFMLFSSKVYKQLGGFDEKYFMYCEDADICTRLWLNQLKVTVTSKASAIHLGQRSSHRRLNHLRWHLISMAKYFSRYLYRLPTTMPDVYL